MVELFIATTHSALKQINEALRNNDLKSVFENSHKMAASCKQIRADRLYQEVKLLEEKSRRGDPLAEVSHQFHTVETEMAEVHHFLRKYMEDVGA
jgi:HPt (histidine-containing phosphotransfer) domain-containing protein